ncbi:MAG: hypothetical protein R3C56_37050 [Pirellulaceae bacterium]
MADVDDESSDDSASIDDGKIVISITGRQSPRRRRRRKFDSVMRELFFMQATWVFLDDMEPDFPVTVGGKRKKVRHAILNTGGEHDRESPPHCTACPSQNAQESRCSKIQS